MSTTQERFAVIRDQMRTPAAKTMVDMAEDLFLADNPEESRMYIRQALMIDKADEDGYTQAQREAIAAKLAAADVGSELAKVTGKLRVVS